MTKTIVIQNAKGGIGKTTITKAIAEILSSKLGKKVLIIDIDGQGSMTNKFINNNVECLTPIWFKYAGRSIEAKKSFFKNVLMKTIYETEIENLYIVPSNRNLFNFRKDLEKEVAAETLLARNIEFVTEQKYFDYIFIDLSPNWDILVTASYLAADSIVQLLDRTEDSIDAAIGNISAWEEIAGKYDIENKIDGILLNRIKGDKMSKEIISTSHSLENLDGKIPFNFKDKVLKTFIPENTNIEKSIVTGGKSIINIKQFDKWKPTKVLKEFLDKEGISVKEGNPFDNLVIELKERGIL